MARLVATRFERSLTRMSAVCFFCLLLPVQISAQTTSPDETQKTGAVARPGLCVAPEDDAARIAITELSATVRVDSSLTDIRVLKSSGFPGLDAAAVSCSTTAKIKAATRGGIPLEVTRDLNVMWNGRDKPSVVRLAQDINTCPSKFMRGEVLKGPAGDTLLRYHIMPDGSVQKPEVLQSSGVPDFDDAIRDCVVNWHYPPATINGVPVEIESELRVPWRFGPKT